jgi:hypothetical protein
MTTDPARISEAVERLDQLGHRLTGRFGPELSGHLLIGAGINRLVSHYGARSAAEFLRHLASEIERETPAPIN